MKIKLEKRDKLLIVIVVCVALCAFLAHQIIGGDGASYDIGFGGLDHVIASERRAEGNLQPC